MGWINISSSKTVASTNVPGHDPLPFRILHGFALKTHRMSHCGNTLGILYGTKGAIENHVFTVLWMRNAAALYLEKIELHPDRSHI